MNRLLLVPLLAALLAAPAWADPGARPASELAPAPRSDALHDLIEVHSDRNPVAVIARDALYGGAAGLLIGGGVALLSGGDNVGRDLAIGAGAGLIVGAIFGAVDAASADRYMAVADSSAREQSFRSQSVHSTSVGYGLKF
ncbi:MAG TPA: hypothetical protein VE620_00175 [Myxococcales bacterium]|jgi:hypothetical protein|nr:hypothetical protein [Myxococcales bacterium]